MPEFIRYYLGEEPLLANVETHLCRNPDGLEYTLDNLDKLVVKMVGESGGYGMLVGPHATPAERGAYAEGIRENPANFIAQPALDLSRAPCLTERGAAPRHVDLRPFVLTGTGNAAGARGVLAGWRWSRAPWSSTPARAAAARISGCCRIDGSG